jgi:hypothetical protein
MTKYKSKRTEYNGRVYASGGESRLAREMDVRQGMGLIKSWTAQEPYVLYGMNRSVICKHVVDFRVVYPDDHIEVEDFKGFQTPEWKIKYKLFLDNYPSIKYVIRTKA